MIKAGIRTYLIKEATCSFGYHAGGGVNIDLGPVVFLGAEGRYLWVQDTFGGTDIKLDGFTVTGDLGFRF